jgi:hypothetical protein
MKRTFFPQRNFDDTFAAFVDMCVHNKWEFPGIPLKMLQDSVKAQRQERSAHDAMQLQYRKLHESFGISQAQRYALFASALHAARGLFRGNKPVMAQLARFTAPTASRRSGPSPSGNDPNKETHPRGPSPISP